MPATPPHPDPHPAGPPHQAGPPHPATPPHQAAPDSAGPDSCCTDEVCVTCSDTAVPVRIVRLLGDGMAVADTGAGQQEEVSVALVSAGVGDTVLVHAREAITVVGGAR